MSNNPADFNRKFLAAFAVLLTLLSFGYIFAITFWPPPKDGANNVSVILGFLLGTTLATVIGFFFGNSKKHEPDATFPQPAKVTIT